MHVEHWNIIICQIVRLSECQKIRQKFASSKYLGVNGGKYGIDQRLEQEMSYFGQEMK